MDSEYVKIFKAFTDESRIRVLEMLRDGEECACVLLNDLKISQPTLSHHMKILCDSGIVSSRRVGKWNYYSINSQGCEKAKKLIDRIKAEKNVNRVVKIMSSMFSVKRFVKSAWRTENKNCQCECCCLEPMNKNNPVQ